MTLTTATYHSRVVIQDARPPQQHAGPYNNPGPAKSAALPHGTGALGSEVGATNDTTRELKSAASEGDKGAASALNSGAGKPTHLGQPNGLDQGIKPPSKPERQEALNARTKEFHSGVPDLRQLARSSAGAQAGAPGAESSTFDHNPSDVITTASTSGGQDSGTGAFDKETDVSGAPTKA